MQHNKQDEQFVDEIKKEPNLEESARLLNFLTSQLHSQHDDFSRREQYKITPLVYFYYITLFIPYTLIIIIIKLLHLYYKILSEYLIPNNNYIYFQ